MIQRIAFLDSAGLVLEVSVCEAGYADEWCQIRGFASWIVASDEMRDLVRLVEPGDTIIAPDSPAPDLSRDPTKAVLRKAVPSPDPIIPPLL